MKRRSWVGCALALVLATGCGDESIAAPQVPEDVTFAASLGIDLSRMTRLASGVYVETLTQGTGTRELATSDWMSALYKLWLPDGTFIAGSPPPLNQPADEFIAGFSQGVVGMRIGEVRRIVIPSALGYGAEPPAGSGIPVQSVLVFEVTLAGIG